MSKDKKHIIIRISNQGVFYNNEDWIDWRDTNFPSKSTFNFNERDEIYWEVDMIGYNKKNSKLELKVIDYEASSSKAVFLKQFPKYPIRIIKFQKLNWSELNQVMNHYVRREFEGLVDFESKPQVRKTDNYNYRNYQNEFTLISRRSDDVEIDFNVAKRENISFKFQYPLIKTKFKMGFVEFDKKIKELNESIKIILPNDHIIPEFDYVKPYFSKVLGKRKIEVEGVVEFDESNEIKVKCSSNEISSIDEEFITGVKKLHLKGIVFSPKMQTVDKSVFTPEELIENMENPQLGNDFKESDKDLMNEILELSDIRNKKQLLYLSGKLQSNTNRLRFTLSPKFGFLFSVEGEEMDHFLWELLDSHATYIWSMSRDSMSMNKKIELLEREINFIRDNGRRSYLSNNKSSEFIFNKISHVNSNSSVIDGFPKWKAYVNEKLI